MFRAVRVELWKPSKITPLPPSRLLPNGSAWESWRTCARGRLLLLAHYAREKKDLLMLCVSEVCGFQHERRTKPSLFFNSDKKNISRRVFLRFIQHTAIARRNETTSGFLAPRFGARSPSSRRCAWLQKGEESALSPGSLEPTVPAKRKHPAKTRRFFQKKKKKLGFKRPPGPGTPKNRP